jgi:hypothetical protein
MAWEPGLLWLTGLGVVNHTTLSDFRVQHERGLQEVFAQLLAVMAEGGYVNLETVMHDGTKIRAQAGADTFRREGTLQTKWEQARAVVEQMGQEAEEESKRRQAARKRAAEEKLARLEAAAEQLAKLQQQHKREEQQQDVRVSLSEPEARLMKHGDNAIAPSYNVQLSTDARGRGAGGSASDAEQQR